MGYTTFTKGANCFETPHNIQSPPYSSLGRNFTPPLEKCSHFSWQKDLFCLATELFKLIIPNYVEKQYVLHFSKMSSSNHKVLLHTDDHNIGP